VFFSSLLLLACRDDDLFEFSVMRHPSRSIDFIDLAGVTVRRPRRRDWHFQTVAKLPGTYHIAQPDLLEPEET
jgi:hypothetical protein